MNAQTPAPLLWDLPIDATDTNPDTPVRFVVAATPGLLDLIERLQKTMLAAGASSIEARHWESLSSTTGVWTTEDEEEADISSLSPSRMDLSVLVIGPHHIYWRGIPHGVDIDSHSPIETDTLSRQDLEEARQHLAGETVSPPEAQESEDPSSGASPT